MEISIEEVQNNGEALVKFRKCPNDTHHLFIYFYKKHYFVFEKEKGEYLQMPGFNRHKMTLRGLKMKLSALKEWYNSSLNSWFTEGHRLDSNKYLISPPSNIAYSKRRLTLDKTK